MAEEASTQASLVARHLESQTDLLRAIVADERSDVVEIAVGDFHRQTLVQDNWPVAKCKRITVTRLPSGTDTLTVTTTGAQILPGNMSRIGGMIVNYGGNGIILYLTDATAAPFARPGKGALYLAPNGGAWDLRLGNVLWAGNIVGVAQGGSTTLTVCEV
jgi:hypothetical protein